MQPPAPQRGDLVGQILEGLYKVERQLDRGGMGTVYLARHLRLGNQVVVKVPAAHAGALHGRLDAEIDQLTELQHPHIVRVRDKVHVEGLPCAVLDYLPGGNLRERMKDLGRPMSPAEVRNWLTPIAQALDHMHGRRIVHRDIKPGNIVFDDADQALLVDFGIAKVTGEVGMTDTGVFPGSPQYMAPELEPAPAYDQFALATVVYECLTGRLPWDDVHSAARLLARKQRDDAPRLESQNPELPRALADCVHRALDRNPARRYASCSEFAEAFRDRVPGPKPPRTRRPRALWLLAAVLVIGGGAWLFSLLPSGGPADTPAQDAPPEVQAPRPLSEILLAPTPNASGAELVVAARTFRPGDTPQSAVGFRPGDTAHIYARTTRPALKYTLLLLVDGPSKIVILHPENQADEGSLTGNWRGLAQVTVGPGTGRHSVLSFASERPWTALLERAAPEPPRLASGELWSAEGTQAVRLADAIADEVAALPSWSRESQVLRVTADE